MLFPDETLSKWEYSGRHLDLHKFETEKAVRLSPLHCMVGIESSSGSYISLQTDRVLSLKQNA